MKAIIVMMAIILISSSLNAGISSFHEEKRIHEIIIKGYHEFPFPTKILKIEAFKGRKEIKVKEGNVYIYPWNHSYLKENGITYSLGAGIKNGKHVVFFSMSPKFDGEIKVYYEVRKTNYPNEYDMLIITPSLFFNEAKEFADFKNKHGIKCIVEKVEDIYARYNGYDDAEKVKYAIKDAIEKYGIKYVLLFGGIEYVPIRKTIFVWRWHHHYWNESVLTDLYYSDIYNADGSFSSWDTNHNGIYGERYYNVNKSNDNMDLYPDVYVGRLAIENEREAKNVVRNIIKYESMQKPWFKNLLLAGGDTFPGWDGYEGEKEIEKIKAILKGFNAIELKTSDGSFNTININKEISKGIGIFYYSGHGFPYGMGTHPPNNDSWIYYLSPYMHGIFNGYKLPIIFFDACLTAKLDFNMQDLINDSGLRPIFEKISNMTGIKFNKKMECFAWSWIKNGKAVATIGATRVSYMDIGTYFFSQYTKGTTLGEMFANYQNEFINEEGKDFYTLEEFILLGDPSLILS